MTITGGASGHLFIPDYTFFTDNIPQPLNEIRHALTLIPLLNHVLGPVYADGHKSPICLTPNLRTIGVGTIALIGAY